MPRIILTSDLEPLGCACPVCRSDGPHATVAHVEETSAADQTLRVGLCASCGKPFLATLGLEGACGIAPEDAARLLDPPVDPHDYQSWIQYFDRIGPADRDAIRRAAAGMDLPRVGVCVFNDFGDARGDAAGRKDVLGQFYPVEAVEPDAADLLLFVHDDAVLRPHAAYLFAEAARSRPDAILFYSDEDRLDSSGNRCAPFFKPAFSRDLFQGIDLLSACFAVRRSALKDAAGTNPRRLAEALSRHAVHHIPHVLHHAKTDLATARHSTASAAPVADVGGAVVSVIVPSHAQEGLVARCVESLYRLNPGTAFDLTIVDNSRSTAYRRHLEAIVGNRPDAAILDWPEPFNFSRMMNVAAARAAGRLLCFLNDDTESITPGWLAVMVSHALRPDIGAVGARLLYADGSIQHAGVVLTGRTGAAHLHHRVPAGSDGHAGLAGLRQEVSAVTAACLMVEAEKFLAVGGFDETELPVNFSDVDLCLKLRAHGFRSLYAPEASLYHHESVSRSAVRGDAVRIAGQKELHRLVSRWRLDGSLDPYYNPNLSTVLLDGALAWPPRVNYPWERPRPVGAPPGQTDAAVAMTVDRRNRLRLEAAAAAFREARTDDALRCAFAVLIDRDVRNTIVAAASATAGLCAEKAGAAGLAEHFLRAAVRRDPFRVEYGHNLGNFLARTGRRSDAIAEFEAILSRNSYFVESIRSLAATLVMEGRVDRAVAVLAKGCGDNPADSGLWLALVEAAWTVGDYAACLGAAGWAASLTEGNLAARALAYAGAVFQVLAVPHRETQVRSQARARGLATGADAGGPTEAATAARRKLFLEPSAGTARTAWIGAAEQRLDAAVRRCDPRAGGVAFSVIMPVFQPKTEDLAAAIASVRRQSHTAWELCIVEDGPQDAAVRDLLAACRAADPRIRLVPRANRGHIAAASNTALEQATGDYLALLDQDDELHPDALLMMADAIARGERPHILFSDEDRIDSRGRRTTPHFKKGWDPLLLLHQNCVSHLGVFRRDAVQRVGGFRLGTEGSQDHDLVLRLMRDEGRGEPLRAVHVPHILYHWRAGASSTAATLDAKPYALAAGRRAVQDHLAAALSPDQGQVVALKSLAGYRVVWPRTGTDTATSIVLTERVEPQELRSVCDLLGIAGAEDPVEVIAATPAGDAIRIGLDGTTRVLGKLGPEVSPVAVRQRLAGWSTGAFLLFCHPVVRFDEVGWIGTLVRFAAHTGVAAAGPKLVDGAGLVVSCGVLPDRRVIGWRLGFGAGSLAPGYFGRLAFPWRTGLLDELCVLFSRDAFEQVGGLRELPYACALDLLDAMMRLAHKGGLAVVSDAIARLDAASRFNVALLAHADPADAWSFRQRWCDALDPAPWHNPNLAIGIDCFRLAVPSS